VTVTVDRARGDDEVDVAGILSKLDVEYDGEMIIVCTA